MTNNRAIIYTSNTGSTARYAKQDVTVMRAKETGRS